MSDEYTWNNPNSIARIAIQDFLGIASDRVTDNPDAVPFKAKEGQLVIGWLRALLARKPSELK